MIAADTQVCEPFCMHYIFLYMCRSACMSMPVFSHMYTLCVWPNMCVCVCVCARVCRSAFSLLAYLMQYMPRRPNPMLDSSRIARFPCGFVCCTHGLEPNTKSRDRLKRSGSRGVDRTLDPKAQQETLAQCLFARCRQIVAAWYRAEGVFVSPCYSTGDHCGLPCVLKVMGSL